MITTTITLEIDNNSLQWIPGYYSAVISLSVGASVPRLELRYPSPDDPKNFPSLSFSTDVAGSEVEDLMEYISSLKLPRAVSNQDAYDAYDYRLVIRFTERTLKYEWSISLPKRLDGLRRVKEFLIDRARPLAFRDAHVELR